MLRSVFLLTAGMFLTAMAGAQTTYLQLGIEDLHLLDRLETKSGHLTTSFFTNVKPISRKGAVEFLLERRRDARSLNLSGKDRYNIDHAISVSGEWTPDENGAIDSKHPWFKTFYKKQPDYFQVRTKDFFLALNPIITANALVEKGELVKDKNRFSSTRGLEFRGWIAKKIGFYTYVTDNQEQPPCMVTQWIDKFNAVPGADFYTNNKTHYDYFLAKGYIDFAVIKNRVSVTAGYDKHFIGNGYRSVFLSDFAAPAAFLRINTKIWKLNYQNLFMELVPQFRRGGDKLLPHKYATMHHLSINATRWLNIGFFENVIFSRRDRYEFSYMNPIIFYRGTERSLGSPDNVNLGFDFKIIAAKRFQLYGQFMLDEFKGKEFFSKSGWWGNKWGLQLGGKYFDAFTVKNLDLQGEINLVRPYTFSHFDSTSNFTHYNQPLAHPLGAGFAEFVGIIKYQPVKNLYLSFKGIYYKQGIDTGSANFGSDIFKNYNTRSSSYGIELINGVRTTTMLANFNASYELRENLFFDFGATHRTFAFENRNLGNSFDNTYFYGGFRLNIARRDYEYY